MDRHPLDPIALVAGLVTIVGGVIALLHQVGAFHLGPGSVFLIACIVLGTAGTALVLLMGRDAAAGRSADPSTGPSTPPPPPAP